MIWPLRGNVRDIQTWQRSAPRQDAGHLTHPVERCSSGASNICAFWSRLRSLAPCRRRLSRRPGGGGVGKGLAAGGGKETSLLLLHHLHPGRLNTWNLSDGRWHMSQKQASPLACVQLCNLSSVSSSHHLQVGLHLSLMWDMVDLVDIRYLCSVSPSH